MKRRLQRNLKRAGNVTAGALAVGLLKLLRLLPYDKTADGAAWVARKLGPLAREHRIGREQLEAAFPDKSPAEIEKILAGVWDNLGRVVADFAHLDRLMADAVAPNKPSRLDFSDRSAEIYIKLANDEKPALVFAAHFGNWEMPAMCARYTGLESAVLYRGPNIEAVERWVEQTRAPIMGELISTGLDAPVKIADALERGAHVGMLVDQYYVRGVDVTFFGRKTKANPLIARLAQHFNCPIHGTRITRLPGNKFWGEITEEIEPARNADGEIDMQGTMQRITDVVEGWVREAPEQWLWLHRRWR
jgi:Kdo2-lipid IVA lauroyltransferase/acyltransferase